MKYKSSHINQTKALQILLTSEVYIFEKTCLVVIKHPKNYIHQYRPQSQQTINQTK